MTTTIMTATYDDIDYGEEDEIPLAARPALHNDNNFDIENNFDNDYDMFEAVFVEGATAAVREEAYDLYEISEYIMTVEKVHNFELYVAEQFEGPCCQPYIESP